MPRLDVATWNVVIGRLHVGQLQHEVARTLNVNQSTIYRLWNRFQQTGSPNDHPRSGRPCIATPGQDCYIWVFYLRNRTVSASTTAVGIPGLRRISLQTVRNWLRQHGIRPRRPYFGAVLTPLHRRERVLWCNILRGWTFRNWCRIWFSDESRFLLQKRDGRIRVYRRGMNISLPPVFRKWIATVEVVSWCWRWSQMTPKQNSCMSRAIWRL
jgi:transposase